MVGPGDIKPPPLAAPRTLPLPPRPRAQLPASPEAMIAPPVRAPDAEATPTQPLQAPKVNATPQAIGAKTRLIQRLKTFIQAQMRHHQALLRAVCDRGTSVHDVLGHDSGAFLSFEDAVITVLGLEAPLFTLLRGLQDGTLKPQTFGAANWAQLEESGVRAIVAQPLEAYSDEVEAMLKMPQWQEAALRDPQSGEVLEPPGLDLLAPPQQLKTALLRAQIPLFETLARLAEDEANAPGESTRCSADILAAAAISRGDGLAPSYTSVLGTLLTATRTDSPPSIEDVSDASGPERQLKKARGEALIAYGPFTFALSSPSIRQACAQIRASLPHARLSPEARSEVLRLTGPDEDVGGFLTHQVDKQGRVDFGRKYIAETVVNAIAMAVSGSWLAGVAKNVGLAGRGARAAYTAGAFAGGLGLQLMRAGKLTPGQLMQHLAFISVQTVLSRILPGADLTRILAAPSAKAIGLELAKLTGSIGASAAALTGVDVVSAGLESTEEIASAFKIHAAQALVLCAVNATLAYTLPELLPPGTLTPRAKKTLKDFDENIKDTLTVTAELQSLLVQRKKTPMTTNEAALRGTVLLGKLKRLTERFGVLREELKRFAERVGDGELLRLLAEQERRLLSQARNHFENAAASAPRGPTDAAQEIIDLYACGASRADILARAGALSGARPEGVVASAMAIAKKAASATEKDFSAEARSRRLGLHMLHTQRTEAFRKQRARAELSAQEPLPPLPEELSGAVLRDAPELVIYEHPKTKVTQNFLHVGTDAQGKDLYFDPQVGIYLRHPGPMHPVLHGVSALGLWRVSAQAEERLQALDPSEAAHVREVFAHARSPEERRVLMEVFARNASLEELQLAGRFIQALFPGGASRPDILALSTADGVAERLGAACALTEPYLALLQEDRLEAMRAFIHGPSYVRQRMDEIQASAGFSPEEAAPNGVSSSPSFGATDKSYLALLSATFGGRFGYTREISAEALSAAWAAHLPGGVHVLVRGQDGGSHVMSQVGVLDTPRGLVFQFRSPDPSMNRVDIPADEIEDRVRAIAVPNGPLERMPGLGIIRGVNPRAEEAIRMAKALVEAMLKKGNGISDADLKAIMKTTSRDEAAITLASPFTLATVPSLVQRAIKQLRPGMDIAQLYAPSTAPPPPPANEPSPLVMAVEDALQSTKPGPQDHPYTSAERRFAIAELEEKIAMLPGSNWHERIATLKHSPLARDLADKALRAQLEPLARLRQTLETGLRDKTRALKLVGGKGREGFAVAQDGANEVLSYYRNDTLAFSISVGARGCVIEQPGQNALHARWLPHSSIKALLQLLKLHGEANDGLEAALLAGHPAGVATPATKPAFLQVSIRMHDPVGTPERDVVHAWLRGSYRPRLEGTQLEAGQVIFDTRTPGHYRVKLFHRDAWVPLSALSEWSLDIIAHQLEWVLEDTESLPSRAKRLWNDLFGKSDVALPNALKRALEEVREARARVAAEDAL